MTVAYRVSDDNSTCLVFADTPRDAITSAFMYRPPCGEPRIERAPEFPFARTRHKGEPVSMNVRYGDPQSLVVWPMTLETRTFACAREPSKVALELRAASGGGLMATISRGAGGMSAFLAEKDIPPLALALGEQAGLDFEDMQTSLEISQQALLDAHEENQRLRAQLELAYASLREMKANIEGAVRHLHGLASSDAHTGTLPTNTEN